MRMYVGCHVALSCYIPLLVCVGQWLRTLGGGGAILVLHAPFKEPCIAHAAALRVVYDCGYEYDGPFQTGWPAI